MFGVIAYIRIRTRAKYQYVRRLVRENENVIRANRMAEALLEDKSRDTCMWKEIKKFGHFPIFFSPESNNFFFRSLNGSFFLVIVFKIFMWKKVNICAGLSPPNSGKINKTKQLPKYVDGLLYVERNKKVKTKNKHTQGNSTKYAEILKKCRHVWALCFIVLLKSMVCI